MTTSFLLTILTSLGTEIIEWSLDLTINQLAPQAYYKPNKASQSGTNDFCNTPGFVVESSYIKCFPMIYED